MKKLLLLPLLFLFSLSAQAEKPTAPDKISGAKNLTAEQVVELILDTPDLIIIDARKSDEYIKGHIEGAINLINTNMTQQTLAAHMASKQTPVLFYCNGVRCLRSTDAAQKAASWGYSNIYWFRGGWFEWREKKLPVSK